MRQRILVIDDDPLFRTLILTLLRKDYLVSVAGNGEEGFHKAMEHIPDVAVIDVQMPVWDGVKTLRAFREQPNLAQVPVVMLTGDASRETVLATLQGGADDYVIKSTFQKQDFLSKLQRLLTTSQATQPAAMQAPITPAATAGRSSVAAPAASLPAQPASETDLPAAHSAVPAPNFSRGGEPVEASEAVLSGAAPEPESGRLQALIDDWE